MPLKQGGEILSSISDYKNRVKGTVKDSIISTTKNIISNNFTSSPSYTEVTINCFPTQIGVHIVDDSDVREQKRILTQSVNPITNGDIITWNEENWIVILTDNMGDIYYRGTLRKCASSLKWLDEDGYEKETYFAFKGDNTSNFGVSDGRMMIIPNERRNILIPNNDDTVKIKKDKRFIFDDRAWKVISLDKISITNLIQLTLEESEYIASDNIEQRIADYYGNVANYRIQILNGDNFSVRSGQTLQLAYEVKNNSNVVNKPVKFTSSNPEIATVDNSGLVTTIANGQTIIKVELVDDSTVSDTAVLSVEFDNVNNYSVSLDSEPIVMLNTTKTFTAVIKNNNVVDNTKTVQWYLFGEDGISQPINASMTFNSTTQCTLKANSLGYVKLKVVIVGINVSRTFDIQVKSLF